MMHNQRQPKYRPGKELETRIEGVFEQLNMLPAVMALRLHVHQVKINGRFVYTSKQPCDYLVLTGERVWAFDAKECSGAKWYPSKAPEHQRQSLQKAMDMGHQAAFAVWFKRFRGMPGSLRWITDFVNPATVESGTAFGWEMFF